jgi:hypothetical protein
MHSVSVVIADRANHEFMIYHELFRGLAITDKGCHRSWNLGTTVLCGNSRKRGNSRNIFLKLGTPLSCAAQFPAIPLTPLWDELFTFLMCFLLPTTHTCSRRFVVIVFLLRQFCLTKSRRRTGAWRAEVSNNCPRRLAGGNLHARVIQTKLSHVVAVAWNAWQRPNFFHAAAGRPLLFVRKRI